MAEPGRRAELATRLERVQADIASAAEAAGRSPSDVTLIVVTKTWPVEDIRALADLGVTHVAENRHPEAEDKARELSELSLTWHFVGQVQTNKASRIAAYADMVHSVDSVRLAQRLNTGAHNHERVVDCLVQVSLDPRESSAGRGGAPVSEVASVAAAIDTAGGLRLRGVMGVAPLGEDARAAYEALMGVHRELLLGYPAATVVSAGMSGDFTEAIAAGATHVRVGSAVLGERPSLG